MRAPDIDGVQAQAWQIPHTEAHRRAHVAKWGYDHAGIATYVIHGARYHPFWSWWVIETVHLRPLEGAPPPKLRYPEAGYEIACWSLNPEGTPYPPNIAAMDQGEPEASGGILLPPDFVVQFHGVTDAQAAEISDGVARYICAGQSCDSDYRRYWESLITSTAEHYRTGEHV